MLGASKIDNQWYIFDPTWGSGFVNNGKFVNAFDDRYFKANPSEIMLLICRLITCGNSLHPISNQEMVLVLINQKRFDFEAEISNIINHLN
jgi:hypothetical protein